MRRSAVSLLAVCFFSLAVTGCSYLSKKMGKTNASAVAPMELYVPSMTDSTVPTSPYDQPAATGGDDLRGTGIAATSSETASYEPYSSGGSQLHTVARRETLFGLARKYYGDQGRWRDIYEANRSAIKDPNKIFVGQRLAIP